MNKNRIPLPMPDHFDPDHAFQADFGVADASALQDQALAWKKSNGFNPVGADQQRIHLLIIDDQLDFSFPEGALYVAGRSGTGAMDAHLALVKFIYANLSLISEITCTLDTHVPFQVFFPMAHLTEAGAHPAPNTIISAEDYRRGRYRPNPAMATQIGVDPVWLQRQFIHYCEQLEKSGKHQLYLWPYHCMLGSRGHALAGVVEEARLFHSFSRGAANLPEIKGGNPLSERYSIFSEEVTTCFDGRPIPGAQKNTRLIKTLLEADAVVLAGLASSHCVRESIADLLGDIQAQDPQLASKVFLLTDCTAPVVIPKGPDFTADAEAALEQFVAAGMNAVESTTAMADWPGLELS